MLLSKNVYINKTKQLISIITSLHFFNKKIDDCNRKFYFKMMTIGRLTFKNRINDIQEVVCRHL